MPGSGGVDDPQIFYVVQNAGCIVCLRKSGGIRRVEAKKELKRKHDGSCEVISFFMMVSFLGNCSIGFPYFILGTTSWMNESRQRMRGTVSKVYSKSSLKRGVMLISKIADHGG